VCLEISGQPKCFAPGEKTALNLPDGRYSAAAWVRVRRRHIYQRLAALRFRTHARVLRVITRVLADICFGVASPPSASSAAARTPLLDLAVPRRDRLASEHHDEVWPRRTPTHAGRCRRCRRGCPWAASARSAARRPRASPSHLLVAACRGHWSPFLLTHARRHRRATVLQRIATALQRRATALRRRATALSRFQHACDPLATRSRRACDATCLRHGMVAKQRNATHFSFSVRRPTAAELGVLSPTPDQAIPLPLNTASA
jgi:hypothetical protein